MVVTRNSRSPKVKERVYLEKLYIHLKKSFTSTLTHSFY
jgi:hypothetical protein